MAQSAMTVRLDSQMKSQFDKLCEQFGMSANTAINIFVNAVVRSKSIPFNISVQDEPLTTREKAALAFASIRAKAESQTENELTLEDINNEIMLTRQELKQP